VAVGAMALALFAFLAATYLTVEANDPALREDFRRRALYAAAAVFVTAFLALILARSHAPRVSAGLMASAWALPVHLLTGLAAVAAIGALWFRRWRLARVAAAAQVSLILWGWAAAQAPYLVPPTLTVGNTAAPQRTLELFLIALGVGALLLFPSIAYLFGLFKSARPHNAAPVEPE
ncbi:MAG: cytochrome d ubiquinol oxidase subunit II, partial [Gemmatimonadaceae bacterium]